MEIIQIVGLGMITTFLALVVKEQKPIFAFLLTIFTGVIIFAFLIDKIALLIEMIETLATEADINLVYVQTIFKIIGIAYIAEFGAQIARDAGQGSVASKIELAGKVLIMIMAIPIISVIIETVLTLIPAAMGDGG
ncbi:stage III sporulation protein AD [Salipaludibacillus agaradhaerens]|uniref:Stage III sporulation protein AD n=1 Tax=Salipaludibacillus agaradhaerens TaxID=76935 RepID=A0A9Q4FYT4_SALAG|nr:stage III sporulation protein AD [Salipaludibacillus agaradhaerens]MCR6096676.1 stage III sporulation protein AD [Salipaludibacillus agaradhaerens]MCR6106418.1 stage III sporulation protein AD [Salipaludibacillus agaradhaerens]MCR6113765.1 stage III sporulation protein AD [Salipaludibacillus agaradhaerens]MCR6118451.1 stage III sporulation protein AD [Salipaludibacillus agaradhaerens]